MKREFLVFAVIAFAACGCAHPQPSPTPVTPPVIGWSWALAAGDQASWTTTLYRATVASLTATCPTPGGSTYTSVGTVAGNVSTFSDPNEISGTFICALTQNSTPTGCGTGGASPCYSPYSPVSTVFAVPTSNVPTNTGTPVPTVTQAMLAPGIKRNRPHTPTMAKNAPMPPGAVRMTTSF